MQVWQERIKEVVQHELKVNSFAAFNTNVDVVVHLDRDNVSNLVSDPDVDMETVRQMDVEDLWELNTKNEFTAVLRSALGKGKSFYIVLQDISLLDWLESIFKVRKESIGGQAGIIANQMAALNANSFLYTSLLSPKQGGLFSSEVKVPSVYDEELKIEKVMDGVNPDHHTKVNWIFEYGKNEVFDFAGETIKTPRANRVILATRPAGVYMSFPRQMKSHLPELGAKIDVAFLAGFHYAPTDAEKLMEYLDYSMGSVRQLKQNNPNLKIHFEYVPMSDTSAEKTMLSMVAENIPSFGINENEIKRVLDSFGFQRECEEITRHERAYCLYEGARRLQEELGFERIQLHNLGYYVVVLKKPYTTTPEKVREACLYASAVNSMKAKYGGYVVPEQLKEAGDIPLSDIGITQLRQFAAEMREKGHAVPENFVEEGILDQGDHYVLIVPAHVIPNPVSTVGMGDTISSSAYAFEAKM